MNFKEELKEKVDGVQAVITRYLPKEEGYQATVLEAMNYSILAGGKRLRPLLMQQTYELFGGSGRVIEPFMAAIEMIHTHSLIHDDLPAIDNDEYRRGVLASKTGIYGMIGGQTVDVEAAGKPLDRGRLNFIYRLKTGALMEASMMIGAILAGASSQEVACVERIASEIGLAFQIRDDILDVTGNQQELGKPINSDEKNQKTTYVTVEGLEKADEDVEEISRQAVERLHSLPYENPFLEELILSLVYRNK